MSKFPYVFIISLILMLSVGIPSVRAQEPFRLVLKDIDKEISVEKTELKGSELTPDSPFSWSVRKYSMRVDAQEGIDVVEVDNGKLKFTVVPAHGMSVLNMQLGDFSPVPVNRNQDKEEINQWIVRSGLKFPEKPSSGSPSGPGSELYGVIGTTPASRVEVIVDRKAPYNIKVRGMINQIGSNGARLELLTEISTVPGTNTFRISDKVTNHSDIEQEIDMLYNINFGSSLVDKGARFFGPMQRIVPINKPSASNSGNYYLYDQKTIGPEEQIYCMVPWADKEKHTEIMLHNSNGDKAVSISYSVEELPFLTLWKKPLESDDGYITSLGPGTGFPVNRDVEKKLGKMSNLAPNQSRSFEIDFSILTDVERVNIAANQVAQIWAGRQTRIETGPQVGMKPDLKNIVAAARTWGPSFPDWYGKPAPDFALNDIEGKTHKLSDYKGKNVVIVLWATWCGPCRVEIPHLIELRNTVSEDELAILGISNENPNLVKRFAEQAKLNYTILLDRGTMPAPYRSVTGIPSSFFVDTEGKIKLATTGLLSLEEIKAILEAE